MINNYISIVEKLKEGLLEYVEEDLLVLGEDFIRFKFKTDDNLVYNKNINIPVCVISLSSIIKQNHFYDLVFRLQKCPYENERFLKNDQNLQSCKVRFISNQPSDLIQSLLNKLFLKKLNFKRKRKKPLVM